MAESDEGQPEDTKTHSLGDHVLGDSLAHSHDGDADHDHDDDFEDDGPLEQNPLWIADNVRLTSVGIDVGSSGTQVIFSRLHLRRMAEDMSSRYFVVARETLHQSPVALTPYESETRISDKELGKILDDAYAGAGLKPGDIDAGAVILTGEALRRENAQAISATISEHGGDFVCATAGHHMESMLAAFGSGAAKASQEGDRRILNVDIGGGTAKLAVLEKGKVVATAAVHIGGRLMVVDDKMRIVRLDPAGKTHAARAGFSWSLGEEVTSAELDRVAETMAQSLVDALVTRPIPHEIAHLYLTDPIVEWGRIGGVMFSGGVAEYVYDREQRDFGDMGRRLGRAVARKLAAGALPWPLLAAGECIRATALGASEYSVQLSGNTTFISNPGKLLPRRNLQVIQPPYTCTEEIDPNAVAQAITAHRKLFEVDTFAKRSGASPDALAKRSGASPDALAKRSGASPDALAKRSGASPDALAKRSGASPDALAKRSGASPDALAKRSGASPDALAERSGAGPDACDELREIALSFHWTGMPSYERIHAFASGLVRGLDDMIKAGKPLFIVLDGDIAQSLGHVLKDELAVPVEVLVIDGVVLWDFDYIDLGKIRLPSRTVPVTIKSLVFSDDPRTGQRLDHEHAGKHHHHHDHGHDHGHGHHHHDHGHHHHSHDHGHGHDHGHAHTHGHGHGHGGGKGKPKR